MGRIKALNWFQKGVLLVMAAMVLVFSVIYPLTIAREGFAYKDAILIPGRENGNTVYSGKIRGVQSRFTVSADKTVEFRYGDKAYGPYTVKEAPSAIPDIVELGEYMTGVEIHCGEKIIFRGGILCHGGTLWLYNEDGSIEYAGFSVEINDEIALDENGNEIDAMEPSAYVILDLLNDPELKHRGEWLAWLCGVFMCAAGAVSILFADGLFRWNLRFQIRNAERAEPSDWEIASRYIMWTLFPIMAAAIFITGLK